jgi:hypothetical protein
MSFQRSLLTRLVEGLVRDFLADADAFAYWGKAVYKGPFVPRADLPVSGLQVIVLPTPGVQHTEPGVGGAQQNHTLSILVGIFAPIANEPLPSGLTGGPAGGPALNEYDRLEKLKRIILAGTNGVNAGKILDPDSNGDTTVGTNYLNTGMPTFRDYPPIPIKKSAMFWSFGADFRTQINNLTLQRV